MKVRTPFSAFQHISAARSLVLSEAICRCKKKQRAVQLVDQGEHSCPKVNLYFGFAVWGELSAKPEEMSGGWLWDKTEKWREERSLVQFCDLLTKPEGGKMLPHFKLLLFSQKGKDGLPSLKWHSHVLPAKTVLSLESMRGKIPSSEVSWYKNNEQRTAYFMTTTKMGKCAYSKHI